MRRRHKVVLAGLLFCQALKGTTNHYWKYWANRPKSEAIWLDLFRKAFVFNRLAIFKSRPRDFWCPPIVHFACNFFHPFAFRVVLI